MSTINLAKDKWNRKMTSSAPANWKRGVTGKGGEYNKGMANFLGIGSINPTRQQAWEAGTGAVSADEFARAVSGKADKWERKLRQAFGA